MLYCLLPEVQKEALRTMPNLEDIGVAMRPPGSEWQDPDPGEDDRSSRLLQSRLRRQCAAGPAVRLEEQGEVPNSRAKSFRGDGSKK
jgi:hypothetical protein